MNKPPPTTLKQAAVKSNLRPEGNVLQRKCACGTHTIGGGECTACDKRNHNEILQSKSRGSGGSNEIPAIVYEVLRSEGQPLEPRLRARMDSGFHRDFSRIQVLGAATPGLQSHDLHITQPTDAHESEADQIAASVTARGPSASLPVGSGNSGTLFGKVRIHTDTAAAESAKAVGARAYTVGSHIVFGAGQYAPGTTPGDRLLAHELTHVLQQQAGGVHLMRQACSHDGPLPDCGGGAFASWRLLNPDTGIVRNEGLDERVVTQGLASNFGGTWVTQVQTPANPEKLGEDSGRLDGLRVNVGGSLQGEVVEVKSRATALHGGCRLATREANGYVRVLRDISPEVVAISQGLQREGGLRVQNGRFNATQRAILRGAGINLNNPRVRRAWRFYNSLQNRLNTTFTGGFSSVDITVNRDGTLARDYAAGMPVLESCRTRRGRSGVRTSRLMFQVNREGGVSYGCQKTPCQDEEEQRRQQQQQAQPQQVAVSEDTDLTTPIIVGTGATVLTAAAIAAARRRAAAIAARRLAIAAAEREAARLAAQAAWRQAAEAAAARRAARAGAGRAVGRAIIYAEAAAAAILLISGRAEAGLGPGDSALETLYRSMASNGTPPTPEMRRLIESDPVLRQLAEQAAANGNGTALSEEAMRRVMELVRDNPGEFTVEDLEVLTQAASATSSSSRAPQTVEQLRAAIDRARAVQRGETVTEGGTGTIGGTGSGTGGAGGQQARPTDAPARQPGSGSPASGPERYPNLSPAGRQQLAEAPAPVRELFQAMTRGSGRGPNVSDEAVRRFLQTVPANLTPAETRELIQGLHATDSSSLDEILTRLQTAVQELRRGQARREGPAEGRTGEPRDAAHESTGTAPAAGGPTQAEPGEPVTQDEFRAQMIAAIRAYRGWNSIPANRTITVPGPEVSLTTAAVGSVIGVYSYTNFRTSAGEVIRAVTSLQVRIASRSGTRPGSTIIFEVVSASATVGENGRSTQMFTTGQRIVSTIVGRDQ